MPYVGHMTLQSAAGTVPEWTVGDRLRKARETTGLNQSHFAERLGVSRNTVSSAEAGAVQVRRITLNAWAMATGVPVEWLETGESSTPLPVPPEPRDPVPDEIERRRRLAELAEQKRRHAEDPATRRYLPAA